MSKNLYKKIMALDLQIITENMQTKKGWEKIKAEQVEKQYRRFLLLCVENPNEVLPSEDLDEYWEMHILDTRKYAADCMNAFGFFLHHVPNAKVRVKGLTQDDLINRFETTKARYSEMFGEEMENAVMSGCDDCIPDYDPPSDPDPQIRISERPMSMTAH